MGADPVGPAAVPNPTLAPQLEERVLEKLGFSSKPSIDLAGLSALYAAFSARVPTDNIHKRIWFAGDRREPLTGGEPEEFFENWLKHGTGGTCWPLNGGWCGLLDTVGFHASRIAASVIIDGYPAGANHGSVVVTIDGVDYFVDAWMAAFKALPLLPNAATSTGNRLHDISATPIPPGFEIRLFSGHDREHPLPVRTEPEHDPVDHAFFLAHYDRTKEIGFFNHALYICRRFPDRILTVGRRNRIAVDARNNVIKTEISDAERRRVLVEELGISEEIVAALPPDVAGAPALL